MIRKNNKIKKTKKNNTIKADLICDKFEMFNLIEYGN